MNVLDATRAWMRAQCPLINRQDLFNANYLGAEPTEYTLRTASEIHRTEPYVYSQMVAGRDAPTFGEAKNSWLTGTAAWTFVSISQAILGVQPELDGLRIDPCIPPEWARLTLTRRFRGAQYCITVENPGGAEHGVQELYVNGVRQDGNLIAPAAPDSVVSVRVVLGG